MRRLAHVRDCHADPDGHVRRQVVPRRLGGRRHQQVVLHRPGVLHHQQVVLQPVLLSARHRFRRAHRRAAPSYSMPDDQKRAHARALRWTAHPLSVEM